MAEISVQILTAGSWPTRDELAVRDAIIAELDQLGLGFNIGAGGGMGAMDFFLSCGIGERG